MAKPDAPQGGFFLAKIPYTKEARSPAFLVDQLQQRGMVIADIDRAERYLNFIGYYRLSGYFRALTDPADIAHEAFLPGTTFDQALDIYIFDRKMRVALSEALERIEVAVKAVISNTASVSHG